MKLHKPSFVSCLCLALMLLGLALAVIGINLDYVAYQGNLRPIASALFPNLTSGTLTLAQLGELNDVVAIQNYETLNTLSVLAIAVAAFALVFSVFGSVADVKFFHIVTLAVSALTLVFAIVAVVNASTFLTSFRLSQVGDAEVSLAEGPIVLFIGDFLSGVGGVALGVLKLVKRA